MKQVFMTKSAEPVDLLVSDVGIVIGYWNSLAITHSESSDDLKCKIRKELVRVRSWIDKNKNNK